MLREALLGTALAAALMLASAGPGAHATANADERRALWVYLDPDVAHGDVLALSPEALAARRARGIPIRQNDYALDPTLVRQLTATGARLRTESRWLSAVSVEATRQQELALRRLPMVRQVVPVGFLEHASSHYAGLLRHPDSHIANPAAAAGARGAARGGTVTASAAASVAAFDSAFYGPNYRSLLQLNIPRVHELGFTGVGVRVAIFDTGFEPQHEALRQRVLGGTRDFIGGDDDVSNQPGDASAGADQERQGTWVWSLAGGYLPGLVVGPAYNAVFYLAKVDLEPGDTRLDEDRWVAAAEWADSMGVDVISSSVTFRYEFTDRPAYTFQEMNGNTTATTRAAREAARRGILVVQSTGMTLPGDGSLVAPADADSILAVGAVDLAGEPVQLGGAVSGRGPTALGATKPELVAPAFQLVGASSPNRVGIDPGLSGTTFATPLIAASAALFMEAWPTYNAQAVRRALLLAGNNATGSNSALGWGVPDVGAAIMFPEGLPATTVAEADGEGRLTTVAPTFRWETVVHPAFGPVRYIVQLAGDVAFEKLLAVDTVQNAFSLQLEKGLAPGTSFYWRVIGESPNGIRRRSAVGRAQSGAPFTVPDWVRLITFAEPNTSTDSVHPTLLWDALQAPPPVGPFSFDVEVLAHASGEVVQRVRNLGGAVRSLRLPAPLAANQPFRWRVIARLPDGQADTVTSVSPFVVNSAEAPPATILYQPFPNPFPRIDLGRSGTSIWFDLAAPSRVQLSVHDLRGRMVRSLIPGPGCAPVVLPPGQYGRPGQSFADPACARTSWDGRDEVGERVPRGVYVIRLVADGKVTYRRVLYQPGR